MRPGAGHRPGRPVLCTGLPGRLLAFFLWLCPSVGNQSRRFDPWPQPPLPLPPPLQDAAVLARCLEALQRSAHAISGERAAWGREADKLAGRVQQEERSAAEAAAASQRRLAALEAEIAGVRRRLAGRRG